MKKIDLDTLLYVSAVALAIGVFLPLTNLPIYGDVTYNRIAQIESFIVIAFALAGPALLFVKKTKLLLIPPVGVWLTLLFPAIKSLLTPKGETGFMGKLGDSASSAMGEFAADLFLNIADFSWGGLIFILGLLAFTASCVMRSRKR